MLDNTIIQNPELRTQNPEPGARTGVLVELAVVTALILAGLWIPTLIFDNWRLAEKMILGAVAAFMLWRLAVTWPGWANTGLGLRNIGRAARLLALPTLAPIGVLVLFGWALGTLDLGTDRFWRKLSPATFAGQYLQQAVVQLYFNRGAVAALGPGPRSIWLVTGIFALIHLPNPILTLGVTYGMWFWARAYQKAPNILAIALSHMLLSAFLWHTTPESWRPSLTVGWRFVERSGWF